MKAAYEDFLYRVQEAKNVKIYGAGKFARTLYLLFARKGIGVDAFVVTDAEQNPPELFHRPVIELNRLSPQESSNLVVGLEKREVANVVINLLLAKQVENIIMVPFDIINDIYCNFVMDESSLETFCEGLTKEEKVIAYVDDAQGEGIVQYLQAKGVQIKAICTGHLDLILNKKIPVLPVTQLINEDRDNAVILTMGSVSWQRNYISKLRESGFEKIILISEEIMKVIKNDHRRLMWEENGSQFRLINTSNVEKNHYIVQREQESKVYRWRRPVLDRYSYSEEMMEAIRSDRLFQEYQAQFPGCSYLPYTETNLCEVQKPDINIEVYMAKFHKDKKTVQVSLPDWVIPIQVGKALTDIQIAKVSDDTGDNISVRNVDYSEGTALYWMWKNTHGQDYIGLFHYRRQMAMASDSLQKLMQYDAILTVPTYIGARIKEFFCEKFILDYDWKLMMQFIKDYDEEYYETALVYENAHCYFPCNIFIMRRQYFDEMCAFIFGVLEKVDGYYENIHMVRKDRYLGYLVENLLSIYIMHNAVRLKLAYTDMKFYHLLED